MALIVRLVVHRVLAIRHRLLGRKYVCTRLPGRPLIARIVPQLHEQLLSWLEPLALILISALMCLISTSFGNYLICGSMAWLIITVVRAR